MLTPPILHPEDEGSKVPRNVGVLPHHYMVSQPQKTSTWLFFTVTKSYLVKVISGTDFKFLFPLVLC
jgi:hypothetical protein